MQVGQRAPRHEGEEGGRGDACGGEGPADPRQVGWRELGVGAYLLRLGRKVKLGFGSGLGLGLRIGIGVG